MRDIAIDFTGTLTATVTKDEFRNNERTFYEDGQLYRISRMIGQKDGSIRIEAKKTDEHQDQDGSLREYPIATRWSPKGTTVERIGKIESRKGKRKFKEALPKPFQPLKGDGPDGKGEKRRRYIR